MSRNLFIWNCNRNIVKEVKKLNLHNSSQNISTVATPCNHRYSADTVDQTNCLQSVQLNADQQAAGVPARNWCPSFPL